MTKRIWFRAYAEMIDDEKLRLLAFEDRWHYVGLLCCKCAGIIDAGSEPQLRWRKIAVKMGVQIRELEEIARRLAEVGLVDESTLQPLNWADRQFESDSSKERVRRFRERQQNQRDEEVKRHGNVTVTLQETDTDTEVRKEKRAKTTSRFVPPTTDEVRDYCQKRSNAVQPERFVNFYEAKGWMVGKNHMKDWKAAVRTWESKSQAESPSRRRKML